MKLISRNIEKYGTVTLRPDEPEDMWHIYNLISVGDSVRASTTRKVTAETASSSNHRVRITLTIAAETIDFNADLCQLHIKGRNLIGNEYVKQSAYHTLDLELHRNFSLRKTEWDSMSLQRLDTVCDPDKGSDLAAVVMQEGLANICLVKVSMTLVRSKIDMVIPRKRKGSVKQHAKAMNEFFDAVTTALFKHVDLAAVKCVLIASPGFVKDQFFAHLQRYAESNDNKLFAENKDKFTLVHSSSGFKSSLAEVLRDPVVMTKISDTMVANEMKLIDRFFDTLNKKPSKAFYGLEHCRRACDANAIETLLVSDRLFRNPDPDVRRAYVQLVDTVRNNGSDVRLFSSMHLSGEMLDKITGIAAILRFPMNEIDDDDDDNENDDKETTGTQ